VFASSEARRKLNKITHPHIFLQLAKTLLWHWIQGTQTIVLDAPLLFETNLQKVCNLVVVVYAPQEVQLQRLMTRNNLSESEATQRIASQMSIEEKRKRAHYVIDNSGELRETQKQVENLLTLIKNKSVWFSRNKLFFIIFCAILCYFVLKYVLRQ
jgi:dephospho-CoA kinase